MGIKVPGGRRRAENREVCAERNKKLRKTALPVLNDVPGEMVYACDGDQSKNEPPDVCRVAASVRKGDGLPAGL